MARNGAEQANNLASETALPTQDAVFGVLYTLSKEKERENKAGCPHVSPPMTVLASC